MAIIAGNYEVLQSGDSLVSGSPQRFTFKVPLLYIWAPAYLMFWVKTGYGPSDVGRASVLLNGTQIGTVLPHPWLNHNLINYDVEAISFNAGLIRLTSIPPGTNDIDFVPPPRPQPPAPNRSYLLLGRVILHYKVEF